MKKVFLLAIIVVLAASTLFISGCGLFGAGDLFQLDIEKVPNAPASLSSGINSRALSLGSINEYEGTFFGNFSYVYQATTNYNSSKEHIEYLRSTPERFINIEEVDVNGYTEKLTFTDENGSMNGIIYQNTDLTQWSAVKLNYDGELRQFNYSEFPNLDEVEVVAPKSILPNQLLDISFDTSNLDRYSGLDK